MHSVFVWTFKDVILAGFLGVLVILFFIAIFQVYIVEPILKKIKKWKKNKMQRR